VALKAGARRDLTKARAVWEGQAMRVVVNGFGRIGRSVLRAWLQGGWPDIEIVGINDIAAADMCAYLFEYDSVFGVWTGSVTLEEGALVLNGRCIALTREPDLSVLDLSGVDVVMECTGRADRAEMAGRALTAGARRVLVSGPSAAAGVTVVLGANEAQLGAHRIVSNASCTTNALAPLARLLDETFGIVTGSMVTIHCYTGSQPTVDAPAADFARSRAAALSMVPTTTSAQRLLDTVLPQIAGRIGIGRLSVYNWLQGKTRPKAETVITVARVFGRPPVEALLAAAYLRDEELDQAVEVRVSPRDLPAEEIAAEVHRRLAALEEALEEGSHARDKGRRSH
jgi:transcriptional regulator with XRE-family HTH domain